MAKKYKAVRGTHDILPDEACRWQFVEATTRQVFSLYGFREIRTPIIESTELFARSVGESTDIVSKEMYTFDRGDESMTLRPENTASVVRAVVEHSLHRNIAAGYPERFYYIGPMFRHERPQKGRQRQFHQIGVEVLGASEPLADAETMQMVDLFLEQLGVTDRTLLVSSVGDSECRPRFRRELKEWIKPHLGKLCDDCNRRYRDNPLRVLDCKVEEDRRLLEQAPSLLDMLCGGCSDHFEQVKKALDGYGLRYEVEPRLVRGLDYYHRTVFEVVASGLGAQNAILGGGRYDGLVQELGGPAIPAFGFALGIERLLLLLPKKLATDEGRPDIALILLGREGWEAAIEMARRFRAAGLAVAMPRAERPMGAQLKRANRAGARYALFVGKDEIAAGRFGLKDLASGDQVTLDERGILARLEESDVR
jgi:histidyl-tRNA synthetase